MTIGSKTKLALGIALAMPAAAWAYTFYALGDSLTDNGRVVRLTGILPNATSTIFRGGRSSNGPVWAEYLPGLIGARFAPDDDYAINGALSGHGGYLNIIPTRPTWRTLPGFVDQVEQLIAAHPRLRRDDLVGVWIGTNDQDLTKASLNGIEPFLGVPRPANIAEMSAYTLTNLNAQLQRLIGAGARQFVILNLNDAGGTRPGYVDYNGKLPEDLARFSRQGVNVHLFDVSALLNQMRRNPSAYGLNDTPDVQCRYVPSCSGGSVELQNTYLTADGTHMMTSVHEYIARYLANQLNAPAAISTAPVLGLDVARAGALSALNAADGGPLGPARVAWSDRLSLFADVGYTRNFHGAAGGMNAFDSDVEMFSIGADYKLSEASRAGALLSSCNANGSLAGGQGRIGLHAYRLGVYHAFERAGLFVRAYAGAGWSQVSARSRRRAAGRRSREHQRLRFRCARQGRISVRARRCAARPRRRRRLYAACRARLHGRWRSDSRAERRRAAAEGRERGSGRALCRAARGDRAARRRVVRRGATAARRIRRPYARHRPALCAWSADRHGRRRRERNL
ncbi:GDSL-like Lipase/Acylhydrolase family protein [Burkholderia pseudomallei]|nr:GDSL-like Lipase/Acylhydrolase family protein [Burkholderia pseudomallei]